MDGESMMDIRYGNGEGRFTLRAAALIIRDGSILLARDDAHDCFYTVGGGIRQNESSAEAARRECREETGCALEVERLLFVQERFYSLGNTPQHEVTFFYLMKDDAVPLRSGAAADQPGEHADRQQKQFKRQACQVLCKALLALTLQVCIPPYRSP